MFTKTAISLALAASGSSVALAAPAPAGSGAYSLIADYSGPNFFDHFTTFTGPDPTHGHVNYTDLDFAAQQKLVGYVYNEASNKTSAYIGVDHTSIAPTGRNSVRLTSKQTFNAGSMVVIDTNHIPVGDGLWPAIWMLGSKGVWPASGESDILEYVHETSYNGMTLHTAPGCNVANATQSFQGRLLNDNCNAGDAATGCSIAAFDQNTVAKTNTRVATAGFKLNQQGGGVYVHDWQADGITVWMFPHGGLPADLVAGKPDPSTWTQKPLAKFSGDCEFDKAFYDMNLIVNIDFCGDWAGKTWTVDGAAERTGVETCDDYVANNPKAFKDAYFDIASVRFYGRKEQKRELSSSQSLGSTGATVANVTKPSTTATAVSNSTGTGTGMQAPPPYPFVNGTHNCTGNGTRNGTSRHGYPQLSERFVFVQTSDAKQTVEVGGWLFGAGLFVLIAFLL